jgi:hypothetical protein
MKIISSIDIAQILKKELDESDRKEKWRILTRRNTLRYENSFISRDFYFAPARQKIKLRTSQN